MSRSLSSCFNSVLARRAKCMSQPRSCPHSCRKVVRSCYHCNLVVNYSGDGRSYSKSSCSKNSCLGRCLRRVVDLCSIAVCGAERPGDVLMGRFVRAA